jgi:hypothetical protein
LAFEQEKSELLFGKCKVEGAIYHIATYGKKLVDPYINDPHVDAR